MKRITYPFIALALFTASGFTVVSFQDWKISDSYSLKFDGGDPTGEFRGLKGTVSFDEKNIAASKFDVSVDVASINTGNGMKNSHAKSAQWFDAEKYPVIKFTSSVITKTSFGYSAKGVLDIHGIKKEINIPFTFIGNVFTSNFEVNRNDFGIGDPSHQKVPAMLKLNLSVPVTK